MLPRPLRLRQSADFVSVMRRGRKIARPTLVLYAVSAAEPRFGVTVGRGVGGSVVRNLVKRRLRHAARPLLEGARPLAVVVRALPRAGETPGAVAGDLREAWADALEAVV